MNKNDNHFSIECIMYGIIYPIGFVLLVGFVNWLFNQ